MSNQMEELNLDSNDVNIYLCGVTVYDDCHIGHARTIIVFDILRRYLRSANLKVNFVQNFTDIDDKIIARATSENVDSSVISKRYIENYYRDFDTLNVLRATEYPKVTENVDEITDFIQKLLQKNMAYVGLNGVYYRVNSFPEYGKLSRKNIDQMSAGARVEVDSTKDDPRDFALWKFSSKVPTWSSLWGEGRPGWHIECSAMALKYLGNTIDIHGGGQDLIFPHHENEIAQSEGLLGSKFAKLWVHVGMVKIQSEKMSKSIGNTIKISDLLKTAGPNVIRLFCVSSHYSKPLDYSESIIVEMKSKWRQIGNAYYEIEFRLRNKIFSDMHMSESHSFFVANKQLYVEFCDHLENNLNFSGAMNSFFRFVNNLNSLLSSEDGLSEIILKDSFKLLQDFISIIGLKLQEMEEEDVKTIESLIEKRNRFRNEKMYEEADAVRAQLEKQFELELIDHKNYSMWKKRTLDDK